MPTTRESILTALNARLQTLAVLVLRDEVLPERIPPAGLIILRGGQPGEPEVTLSPLRYHYQHRAELEVVVQAGTGRASAFDTLIASIGTALETDRTCGPHRRPARRILHRGPNLGRLAQFRCSALPRCI
jgi:hypothetical protein